jgi:hypothetical protein
LNISKEIQSMRAFLIESISQKEAEIQQLNEELENNEKVVFDFHNFLGL